MNPLILDFAGSYSHCTQYPTQLVHKSVYGLALKASQDELSREVARGLCLQHDKGTDIVFRDLGPHAEAVKRNIYNDVELRAWLEYQVPLLPPTTPGPQRPEAPMVSIVPKTDPKCRFIYLWGGTSRERLKLTQRSLTRILTYHQVMPAYLDFLYCFGLSEKARDLGYSGFREQTLLSKPTRRQSQRILPAMGRSGQQYQMCYNLKAPYWDTEKAFWSIRPASIHHQFDIIEGTTVWIIIKGELELKRRIESMTNPDGREEDRSFETPGECFRSSLAVHLLLARWSADGWRSRIKALEDEIDQSSYEALDASQAPGRVRQKYTPDHLFKLHGKSEKTHEAIMVMEANIDVLTAKKQYYEKLLKHKDFTLKTDCEEDIISFATQIEEMIYDTKMQVSRAKLLAKIADDRKDMITRRLDSQTQETMESLTTSMYNVGVLSQTEAAAMRVVTVLTMLYLPATFVSTFFSTDVVHYSNQNNNSPANSTEASSQPSNNITSFSALAMERWIEVTLPLTLVTVLIAWWLYEKSKKRIQQITGFEGALPLHQKPLWKDEKARLS